jgi:hypothetical protein
MKRFIGTMNKEQGIHFYRHTPGTFFNLSPFALMLLIKENRNLVDNRVKDSKVFNFFLKALTF